MLTSLYIGIYYESLKSGMGPLKKKGIKMDSDRDEKMFTLWWTSSDRKCSMFAGNFASEQEAWDDVPCAEMEFREQCNDDVPYDEESTWSVEPPDDD